MKLYESITNEKVSQLALRRPVICPPETGTRTAIEQMQSRRLGCILVVDEDNRPLGYFTESMVTQLLANNPGAIDGPIGDCMSEQCPTVREHDSVSRVLRSLQRENTRFLCVLDEYGRVSGLTGQKGLMEYVADHFPEQVMVQRVGGPPQEREGA